MTILLSEWGAESMSYFFESTALNLCSEWEKIEFETLPLKSENRSWHKYLFGECEVESLIPGTNKTKQSKANQTKPNQRQIDTVLMYFSLE